MDTQVEIDYIEQNIRYAKEIINNLNNAPKSRFSSLAITKQEEVIHRLRDRVLELERAID